MFTASQKQLTNT